MSDGGCRIVVIPDQWRSFQNRFDGCAYAKPVTPVIIPGLTPTNSRTRFGGIQSRRRLGIGEEEDDDGAGVRFPRPRPGFGISETGLGVGVNVGVGVVGRVDLDRVETEAETSGGVEASEREEDDRDRVIGGDIYASLVGVLGCLLRLDGLGVWRMFSSSPSSTTSCAGFRFTGAGDDSISVGTPSWCMNWLSAPLKLVILLTGTSWASDTSPSCIGPDMLGVWRYTTGNIARRG